MDPISYLKNHSTNTVASAIAKSELLGCVNGSDVETLGAIYIIINNYNMSKLIDPTLTFEEDFNFRISYYEKCLLSDPQSEWANSSYEAAWDTAAWMAAIWRDPSMSESILQKIKNWLATMYLNGDNRIQKCLINGTLEHIFEVEDIAKYFKDWLDDPVLKTAYTEAMLWSEYGGSSLLVKKPKDGKDSRQK